MRAREKWSHTKEKENPKYDAGDEEKRTRRWEDRDKKNWEKTNINQRNEKQKDKNIKYKEIIAMAIKKMDMWKKENDTTYERRNTADMK